MRESVRPPLAPLLSSMKDYANIGFYTVSSATAIDRLSSHEVFRLFNADSAPSRAISSARAFRAWRVRRGVLLFNALTVATILPTSVSDGS